MNYAFSHIDLIDMRNMSDPDVESTQLSTLEKVAFTKAARECSGFKAKKDFSICQCKGKCNTNKCSCRKNNLACSTKNDDIGAEPSQCHGISPDIGLD